MHTVKVNTGSPYFVFIERGLFSEVAQSLRRGLGDVRLCVVTDRHVGALYAERLLSSMREAGYDPALFTFEAGEAHKSMETVEGILTFLEERSFTSKDVLVALGGGIVGDVTGFSAAIYRRGIRFVQIPTTLLAAVDASVGGKTGVNFAGAKNQVGAFWQPTAVFCDPDMFTTLSAEQYADGVSEVVKYGVAFDRELFEMMSTTYDVSAVVARCVEWKAKVVSEDERDTGTRRLLNFGHTVGHAIESYTKGEFSHGQAVAVGMMVATRSAVRIGFCHEDFLPELEGTLNLNGLPTGIDAPKEDLLAAMRYDKKTAGEEITLVLPRRLGECALYPTTLSALGSVLVF